MSIPMNLLEYTQETDIQETRRDRMPRWQNDLMLGAARQWWTRQMTPNMQQVTIHDRIKREDMARRLDLLATTQSSDLLTIDIILSLPGTHFSLNFHSIWISLTHSHYFVRSEIGSTRHLTINCTDPGTHFSLNLHIIWTGSTNSHYSAHREIRSTSSPRYRNHTMTIYKGCFLSLKFKTCVSWTEGATSSSPSLSKANRLFNWLLRLVHLTELTLQEILLRPPRGPCNAHPSFVRQA